MHGQGSRAKEMEYLRAKGFSKDEVDQKMAHINAARKEMGQGALMQGAFLSTGMASTAWNDDPLKTGVKGSAAMARDLELVSGGNAQSRAQLATRVKENAQRSGRTDLNAPFANTYGAAKNIGLIQSNANLTPEQKRTAIIAEGDKLHDKIWEVDGPGAMVGGKGSATENLIPAARRAIDGAAKTRQVTDQWAEQFESEHLDALTDPSLTHEQALGREIEVDDGTGTGTKVRVNGHQINESRAQADRKLTQSVAAAKTVHAVLGQVSPEKRALVADNLLSKPMPMPGFKRSDGAPGTVLDYALSKLNDPVYYEATSDFLSNVGRSAGLTPGQIASAEADARAHGQGQPSPITPPLPPIGG
jgi:hypothetical protein